MSDKGSIFTVTSTAASSTDTTHVEVSGTNAKNKRLLDTLPREFIIAIGQGQVPGMSIISKAGNNNNVAATPVDIATQGAYTFQSTAAQLDITSTSAADTAAGTGARTLFLEGLDVNRDQITEIVTLNGLTIVTTTASFLAINNVKVVTAGSGDQNAGTIIGLHGVDSIFQIAIGDNKALQVPFTVPNGFTAYIFDALVSGDANKIVEIFVQDRPFGEVFSGFRSLTSQQANFQFKIAKILSSRSEFRILASTSPGTADISVAYSLILVEN